MFDGRSLPAPAAHDVVCAMTDLERGLNPSASPERPVPEPDAYEVLQAVGMVPAWQRYVPWVDGLLCSRKRIHTDLGWVQWPWQFEHPLGRIAPDGPECLIGAAQRLRETCKEHERLLTNQSQTNWTCTVGGFWFGGVLQPLGGVNLKLLASFRAAPGMRLTAAQVVQACTDPACVERLAKAYVCDLNRNLRDRLGLTARPVQPVSKGVYQFQPTV
jgi:hypothetical protein